MPQRVPAFAGFSPVETSVLDDLSAEDLEVLTSVDSEGWKATLPQFEEWLNKLDKYAAQGHPLPAEIRDQLAQLKARLG